MSNLGGDSSLPFTVLLPRDSISTFSVKVCANEWAEAGKTHLMGIDVSLVDDLSIGDDIELSTTISAIHDLRVTLLTENEFEAKSGERYEFRIAIQNQGNILEIIEPKIDGFGDIPGIGVLFAEDSPETLNPGESADLVGYVEVNDYAIAGMNIIK